MNTNTKTENFLGYLFVDGVLIPQIIKKTHLSLFFERNLQTFNNELKKITELGDYLFINSKKQCYTPKIVELIIKHFGNIYLESLKNREISILKCIDKQYKYQKKRYKLYKKTRTK